MDYGGETGKAWYIGNDRRDARMVSSKGSRGSAPLDVERVQTGVRMEKRILKVLKALAELHDMSLGDLLEGIVLHAFEGKSPFSAKTLAQVAELKRIYSLDLDATASHNLRESVRRASGR